MYHISLNNRMRCFPLWLRSWLSYIYKCRVHKALNLIWCQAFPQCYSVCVSVCVWESVCIYRQRAGKNKVISRNKTHKNKFSNSSQCLYSCLDINGCVCCLCLCVSECTYRSSDKVRNIKRWQCPALSPWAATIHHMLWYQEETTIYDTDNRDGDKQANIWPSQRT